MSRLWRGAAAVVLAAALALRAGGQATPEVIVVPESAPPGAAVEGPATRPGEAATRPSDAATQPATLPVVEEVEPEMPPPVREYALRAEQQGGAVRVYDGKRVVMEYRFADDGGDPRVTALATPGGAAVLGEMAAGLSMSIAANNTPEQRQVHAGVVLLESAVRGGVEQVLHWKGAEGATLVEESRSVQVMDVPELEVTLVHWKSKLRAPRGGAAVRLSGLAHRDGLRLIPGDAASGEVVYTFSDPAAKGEKLRTGAQLTPGEWCAMAVRVGEGRWVTVVLMAHPANPPPAVWFTRGEDGPVMMAGTLIGWKEPVVLKAGESVELAYGVAAFDGRVEGEAVGKVYKHWKRVVAPKPKPKLLEP